MVGDLGWGEGNFEFSNREENATLIVSPRSINNPQQVLFLLFCNWFRWKTGIAGSIVWIV